MYQKIQKLSEILYLIRIEILVITIKCQKFCG